jgi:hypothetical protein
MRQNISTALANKSKFNSKTLIDPLLFYKIGGIFAPVNSKT